MIQVIKNIPAKLCPYADNCANNLEMTNSHDQIVLNAMF